MVLILSTLLSCSEKKENNTAVESQIEGNKLSDSLAADSTVPKSSADLVVDSLKSGKGTNSMAPADPMTGTGSSENGLSTDVGGKVSDEAKEKAEQKNKNLSSTQNYFLPME